MKLAPLLATAVVLFSASLPVLADQPHMQDALAHLQQARDSLQRASNDKGGNRVDAIRAIDKAIAEVQRGIEYDRRHPTRGEGGGGGGGVGATIVIKR